MVNYEELGWDPRTVGELDHRLLQAPHIKLRSATIGPLGDVVYAVDIRINKPNECYLTSTEMHSFEHFLLDGFLRYMPNHFISIGLMGCQTGFYLILYNEGRAEVISDTVERILKDVLTATEVPFRSIIQCGNYLNHDLGLAQGLAKKILANRGSWSKIV